MTTLAADEPGKAEVSAYVIRSSLFVCDDRQLAVEMGALRGVGLGAEVIGAELGEVLGGSHPGRTSDEQRTIYGGVGLPFHDFFGCSIRLGAKRKGIVFAIQDVERPFVTHNPELLSALLPHLQASTPASPASAIGRVGAMIAERVRG